MFKRRTCAIVLCLLGGIGLAQAPTGSILGTVTDASGAVITQTKLRLRNLDSGEIREGKSGEEGDFNLVALPPARYELVAEFAGFRKHTEANIVLNVDQ